VAALVNDEGIANVLVFTHSKTMIDLCHKNRQGLMPFELALLFNSFDVAPLLIPEHLREDHLSALMQGTQKERQDWDDPIAQLENEYGRLKSNDWDEPIQVRNMEAHPGQHQDTSALDTVVVDFLIKEGSLQNNDIVHKYEKFKRALIVHS